MNVAALTGAIVSVWLAAGGALAASTDMSEHVTDYGLTPAYAESTWPTLHRDSRNSDFAPFVGANRLRVQWEALDHAAIAAGMTIGPEGNHYVTTGQASGPNLFAFGRLGRMRWSRTMGAEAVMSSPIVDRDGDLYVSDAETFRAFHADGREKWRTPLPMAPNPFVTAFFTRAGFVGGVSVNGLVLLFDRGSGALMSYLELPVGEPVPAVGVPAGLWRGMMDPRVMPLVLNAFLGSGVQVANTPAVNPLNDRIYIPAAGPSLGGEAYGMLYGIDLRPDGSLALAFGAAMGPGSGSSAAISPDGHRVYAADGKGTLYAFDALTELPQGERLWAIQMGQDVASPSIDAEGRLYSMGGSLLSCIEDRGDRAVVSWQIDFRDHIEVPPVPAGAVPSVRINSVISLTPRQVYVTATSGFELRGTDGAGKPFSIVLPAQTQLFTIDGEQHNVVNRPVTLRDTTEGSITVGADGTLYVTHLAAASTFAYYQVLPQLPPEQQQLMLKYLSEPIGGITALWPIDYPELVTEGLQWVDALITEALSADVRAAYTAARRGVAQLEAALTAVDEMHFQRPTVASRLEEHVLEAAEQLKAAKTILAEQGAATDDAAACLTLARTAVHEALQIVPRIRPTHRWRRKAGPVEGPHEPQPLRPVRRP